MLTATVCDYVSDLMPKFKKVFVAASLGLDGFAKYLLRKSQNSGELSRNKEKQEAKPEVEAQETDEDTPLASLRSIQDKLKSSPYYLAEVA